jgi:3D (Asp-Asp-Asp) domain-containing protein
MMKRILGWQGALLVAAVGVVGIGHPSSGLAAQFDQTEISDQSRLIVIAAPLGTKGGNHRLLVLEQLNDRRLCWQESGGNPTLVNPLLLEFDFTGICGRGTDSNSYSVRVAGQDLAGRYNLRIVRKSNDLVLIGFSLVDKEVQFFEIGRTNGLTDGFAKINLDPGWRLARRSFQGKNVGHIYLINDQSLAEVAKKAVPLQRILPLPQTAPSQPSLPAPTPSLPAPTTAPVVMPAQPPKVESAPPAPQPLSYPVSVPPMPPMPLVEPASSSPTPPPVAPPANPVAKPSSSPSGGVPPAPMQNFVVPTVAPENPASAPFNPTPPVPSTNFPPQSYTPINGSNFGNLSYRVVVNAATLEQQSQVKQFIPSAFRTSFKGQTLMQVGLFRDRATAESLQQQLNLQNIQAQIISTGATATTPILPNPLIASASLNTPLAATGMNQTAFNFPEPNSAAALQSLSMWATYYTTHQAEDQSSGYPLLDPTGNSLGVSLSERDWCAAALEGSVQVTSSQSLLGVYNYAGRGEVDQVNCAAYYPTLKNISATNRVRFRRSNTLYGEGVGGNLVPYRTIAVDRALIPIGSVVYIPEARGISVVLPSGDRAVHDGYFYAGDVGNAIKGNHIDIFLGIAKQNPFPFVKSTASSTFNAYIVQAPSLQAMLTAQHRSVSTSALLGQIGRN